MIVAVSNQKGGVAKTTTCLSLGAALAARGRSVWLIDLDPQANLTLGLGFDPQKVEHTSLELLVEGAELDTVLIDTAVPGMRLIPSAVRLSVAERRLLGELGFDEILSQRLRDASFEPGAPQLPDFVLIDAPPSLGVLTLNALSAADLVVVPVQCDFYAATGLSQLMDTLRVVKARRRPDQDLLVVPTLFDRRTRICREVLEQLRSHFAAHLSEVCIGVDVRIREAALHGLPVELFAPRTRSAREYRALAAEILARSPHVVA